MAPQALELERKPATRGGRRRRGAGDCSERPVPVAPSGPRLDGLVVACWEQLREQGVAECLVCGDEMRGGGDCRGCGSALS